MNDSKKIQLGDKHKSLNNTKLIIRVMRKKLSGFLFKSYGFSRPKTN